MEPLLLILQGCFVIDSCLRKFYAGWNHISSISQVPMPRFWMVKALVYWRHQQPCCTPQTLSQRKVSSERQNLKHAAKCGCWLPLVRRGEGAGGAPSMGAHLRVQVPPRAGHSERSETQLHEGDQVWVGSVERKP